MRDVLKITLPKSKIMAMPPQERAKFLLLGYAANQVAFYSKLAILSTNYVSSNDVENTLSAAQSLMLLRTIAGVLHETWEKIIKAHFISHRDGKKYLDGMDAEGKQSLEKLNKLFGKSGLIAKIRNDFAFHYPKTNDMEAACQLMASDSSSDPDWHWYFAKSGWNSFYYLSEIIVMHGVLKSAGCDNIATAQERLASDMRVANNEMVTILQCLIASMWATHIGEDFEATVVAKLHGAASLFEFSIPYFFDVPEESIPDPSLSLAAGVAP